MRMTVVASGLLASLSLQYKSASLIEFIWTLTGLVGIYLTSGNLKDARKYITAIRTVRRTDRTATSAAKVVAFGHYRNEIIRLTVFLAIAGAGVVVMLTPPATTNTKVSPAAITVTLLLFTIAGLLVMASFLDRRQRDLLLSDLGVSD